jgi:NADPH-dependent curcumin reductase CurA
MSAPFCARQRVEASCAVCVRQLAAACVSTRACVALVQLLTQRARMEGFIVFDFAARYKEAAKDLASWYLSGKIKSQEHVIDGLENAADSLQMLFSGGNKGKLLVKVGERAPHSKL